MNRSSDLVLEQPTGSRGSTRQWAASLIAPLADAGVGTRASFVATSFAAPAPGERSVLHVSAQGLYVAYLNGARIGDGQLTPGWTCYDDRISYQSYDITELLSPGDNRLEIWLGDGWYRSQMMWKANAIENCWGDRIAAIAEIQTGEVITVKTDQSWRSGLLPITASGIYYGEDFDARLATTEDSHGVESLAVDTDLFVSSECESVTALEPIAPIDQWTEDSGATVYDFGQNVGGFVRIMVRGDAGTKIRIEHSEVLGAEREFDNRNYRSARAEAHYTLKGGDAESYQPHFTFMGYRYARLSIEGSATVSRVESVPLTSVPSLAGGVSTGEPQVDKLVSNTVWSQRGNFIEVPTDCPQRDERLGWTGDAQVFAGTACWLADSELFLRKYLRDLLHDQREDGAISHFSPDPTRIHPDKFDGTWAGSTGWGDAIVIIPWQLYLHYGKDEVLHECFPAMRRWVDYLWSLGEGPIVLTQSAWGKKGFTFGDWIQPIGDNRLPRPTIAADCAATLYHYISTKLTADIAGIVGESEQQQALNERAEQIRAAFAHEYISPSGRLAHNDQTSYALAFLHDLIPAQHIDAAKAYFRKVIEDAEGLIGTGFIGTPALLPALSKLGMSDLAEQVFLNRKVPGWLYQVECGATTIWERWDAMGPDGEIYDPDMNSYNHYAYGAVCQWIFESVGGVSPNADAPGFDRISIDPIIMPALSPVSVWHDCRHGRIEAGWTLEGKQVSYQLSLPPGTEGLLLASASRKSVTLNGAAIDVPAAGAVIPAGQHSMTFELHQ